MIFIEKSHNLLRKKMSSFLKHGAIQRLTLELSTLWVLEVTPMPILLGETIATCAKMTNGDK